MKWFLTKLCLVLYVVIGMISCVHEKPVKTIQDIYESGIHNQQIIIAGQIIEEKGNNIVVLSDKSAEIEAMLDVTDKTITKLQVGDFVKIEAQIKNPVGKPKYLEIQKIRKIEAIL